MKTHRIITLSLLAGTLAAQAQFNFNYAFNSGSDGSYGPLNVTSNTTLTLPTNGIFNCTTIMIANNATLTFNRSSNNTPVYLLALGNVSIAGTIDVSGSNAPTGDARVGGAGGPGGFDGGFPAFNSLLPGDGYGPGGGRAGDAWLSGQGDWGAPRSAGYGSYATFATSHYPSTNKGATYGSALLVPLVGGSGGGGTAGSPGVGGGGGGGAVLIASSTRIDISGTIRANAGRGQIPSDCGICDVNPGSGGAIRLVAPVVAGAGSLSAVAGALVNGVGASYGRIRVDSIDRRSVSFIANPAYIVGTYMVTFPPSRLDLVNVAGTNIVEGSGPVAIQLPNDSPTNTTVTVQAKNFSALVTNLVVLTPENGPRIIYTNVIDNTAPGAATNTITIGLPVNTIVTISAWTR